MNFKQIHPDCNLNGSGIKNLIKLKQAELEAIKEANIALLTNFPHPRDYQLAGFYIQDATEQQLDRFTVLRDLGIVLEQELEYLVKMQERT